MRSLPLFALLAAFTLGLGCQSISDSITSPSRWLADSSTALGDSSDASAESSNAASKSVSGSSSPDDESEAAESGYRDDVRLAARAWGDSTETPADFSRELSRIAASHGVADWQALPATWGGVSAGLTEAGVPHEQIEQTLHALKQPSPAAAGY